MKKVIAAVDNTGAWVISLTGDGLAANRTVAALLGADFNAGKTYIFHVLDTQMKRST